MYVTISLVKGWYIFSLVPWLWEGGGKVTWTCIHWELGIPIYMHTLTGGQKYTTCRYRKSRIFHAINFHVKQFSDKRPCTTLSLILRMYVF